MNERSLVHHPHTLYRVPVGVPLVCTQNKTVHDTHLLPSVHAVMSDHTLYPTLCVDGTYLT